MEDLGFDNIMSYADLFGGEADDLVNDVVQQDDDNTVDKVKVEGKQENTEVNPNSLFGGVDESESVGVDNDKYGESKSSDDNADSSPTNIYSSILGALKDIDALPELTDEEIENSINNKDFNENDLKDMIEKVLDSRIDARTKRMEDAMNGGADVEEVKQFENILATLNNIDDSTISEEGSSGEDLRRRIIALDYMNKGFSKERIERELKKSFDAGTDVDDAKEALQNNIQFYTEKYQGIIKQGQENARKQKEQTRKQSEELRKSIVDSNEGIFNDIGVDKKMRQKIYDSISKPVYKDENGIWYTEIQKYEKENKTDFLKNVAMFYVMTDGFKNIDKVVNKQVQKQKKQYVADLEKKLANTQRNSSGNLKLVGQGDPESLYLGDNLIILD